MSNESKAICKISIGDGMYDNDYTFYENGKVFRQYDKNNFQHDLEAWYDGTEINGTKRDKIIAACPEKYREIVIAILDGRKIKSRT